MAKTEAMTDHEALHRLFDSIIPFNRFLGIHAVEIGDGEAVLKLPFRSEFVGNPVSGALHGGAISALLDPCGGLAVWSRIGLEDVVSTVDLRVDYLRPAVGGDLYARGSVVRIGNRVGVVQLRAYHEGREDRPVAAGTGVYNVRRADESGNVGLRELINDLRSDSEQVLVER